MRTTGFRLLGLVLIATFASACATYVNIPPQLGDVAEHDPNRDTVLQVSRAALQAVLDQSPQEGKFQVVLPPGTTLLSYQKVVWSIDRNAVFPTTGQPDPNLPTLDVRQIRIRGWYAQADVIRPADDVGDRYPRELVTVDLKYDPVNKWHPTGTRVWSLNVEQALERSVRESELNAPAPSIQ